MIETTLLLIYYKGTVIEFSTDRWNIVTVQVAVVALAVNAGNPKVWIKKKDVNSSSQGANLWFMLSSAALSAENSIVLSEMWFHY